MTKKSLDEKYFYQIDENNVVHLFREEEDCQQLLTNPLLSAIFKIESLEKEHTELKLKLEALEGQTPWKDIKDKSELIKENTKLKEESKKIFNDWLNACDKYGKVNLKLTKAKEIIKKFSEFANLEVEYDPEHPQEHTDLWNELYKEAEQFLREVENV